MQLLDFSICYVYFIFILFFFFIMILSSFLVITSKNTVYSVLYLVLVFFNASMILLLIDAEFLAMIFLVIYVGAIAVLFLFVVMMLNIRIVEVHEYFMKYIALTSILGLFLLLELFFVLKFRQGFVTFSNFEDISALYIYSDTWLNFFNDMTNVQKIGHILFVRYYILFLLAGIILLISMIGSIILTLQNMLLIRRQHIYKQINSSLNFTHIYVVS